MPQLTPSNIRPQCACPASRAAVASRTSDTETKRSTYAPEQGNNLLKSNPVIYSDVGGPPDTSGWQSVSETLAGRHDDDVVSQF